MKINMDSKEINELITKIRKGEKVNIPHNANLSRMNLQDLNLSGYNLYGINLSNSNLSNINLSKANLCNANLLESNLWYANLYGADLKKSICQKTIFRGANLSGACMLESNLYGADLFGANIDGTIFPDFQIPQEGELIVWKRLKKGLAKLLIPSDAKRTASLVGRKCRAEFAKVLWIECEEKDYDVDIFDGKTKYIVNQMVYPDHYDDNICIECTNGIHFFLTKKEAEKY